MNPYLTHLLTLSNAATEGPWKAWINPHPAAVQARCEAVTVAAKSGPQIHYVARNYQLLPETWKRQRHNAAFIAEARTAVPRLVEMVREAVDTLETIKSGLESSPSLPKLTPSEMAIESIARRALARVEQLAKGAQP